VIVNMAQLDAMPAAEAVELLSACCGARRWVQRMLARRPFESTVALLEAADREWVSLSPEDWREAFSRHPRIGENAGDTTQTEQGRRWSAGEQRGMEQAGAGVREALARANREYEARFGYIYIVCATGKSAGEMLAMARARLANTPESELLIAAQEQQKIMRRRLETMLR
jgi:2-oxo-4-hydroxy-4-carboxy-5-ureidoimidazoline decarboxylase